MIIDKALSKIFGTKHDRDMKALTPLVEEVGRLGGAEEPRAEDRDLPLQHLREPLHAGAAPRAAGGEEVVGVVEAVAPPVGGDGAADGGGGARHQLEERIDRRRGRRAAVPVLADSRGRSGSLWRRILRRS